MSELIDVEGRSHRTITDLSVEPLWPPPVDDLSSASSYATSTWISWFLSSKGNEYFCEVDEDYILDRFNLTGLNAEVQHYPQALDLVTDAMEEEMDQETRDHIEAQGRLLYGLVHARYIITSRGLAKMVSRGPSITRWT